MRSPTSSTLLPILITPIRTFPDVARRYLHPEGASQTLPESLVTGSRTTIRVPPTELSSRLIVPLWAETIAAQMASPRPAPPVFLDRETSPREKRSKITGRRAAGTPGPVSVIEMAHPPGGV